MKTRFPRIGDPMCRRCGVFGEELFSDTKYRVFFTRNTCNACGGVSETATVWDVHEHITHHAIEAERIRLRSLTTGGDSMTEDHEDLKCPECGYSWRYSSSCSSCSGRARIRHAMAFHVAPPEHKAVTPSQTLPEPEDMTTEEYVRCKNCHRQGQNMFTKSRGGVGEDWICRICGGEPETINQDMTWIEWV